MSHSVTGKIHQIFDTREPKQDFHVRDFVVLDDSNPEYPQHIKFELIKDKVDLIDGYNVGDYVTVNFNLRGREYVKQDTGEVRYFNSLHAWRIQAADADGGGSTSQPQNNQSNAQPAAPTPPRSGGSKTGQQQPGQQTAATSSNQPAGGDEDDGLPF